MVVLAVIGWVLLGLLALVVLLLVVPMTVTARYREGQFEAFVRIFFIRLRVFPLPFKAKEKPAREKKPKAETEDEAEDTGKKKKKQRSREETITLAKRLAKAGQAAMKVFFRHARFHGVQLVLPVHAEDASDTALRCGQLQTAIGTVRAVLDGRIHIRYKRLELIPDFANQHSRELLFACKLTFCPGIILGMGASFLIHYLKRRPYSKKAYKQAVEEKRRAAAARQNGNAA